MIDDELKALRARIDETVLSRAALSLTLAAPVSLELAPERLVCPAFARRWRHGSISSTPPLSIPMAIPN